MSNKLARELSTFVRELYATDDIIPLHAPQFDEETVMRVSEVVRSSFVSTVGPEVYEFEREICNITRSRYAVATSNGTSALHLCVLLADVEPGDLVITSSITFVATCNAISYAGATPLFVDIDSTSLSIDPDALEGFLEEEAEVRNDGLCWHREQNKIIRACLVVHCLGHPARIEALRRICEAYSIEILEDAAEALGSHENGLHVGASSRASAISFNGNKIVTTGGGGMVLLKNSQEAEHVKHLSTQAKESHPWEFVHDRIGFNYRMPNLNAALGLGQLISFGDILAKKRLLFRTYREWFSKKGVSIVDGREGTDPNYWINAVLLESRSERDEFLETTNQAGIMTRPLWTPMYRLPMYAGCVKTEMTMTNQMYDKIVTIPSSPNFNAE